MSEDREGLNERVDAKRAADAALDDLRAAQEEAYQEGVQAGRSDAADEIARLRREVPHAAEHH